jgi:hypothetical protein
MAPMIADSKVRATFHAMTCVSLKACTDFHEGDVRCYNLRPAISPTTAARTSVPNNAEREP